MVLPLVPDARPEVELAVAMPDDVTATPVEEVLVPVELVEVIELAVPLELPLVGFRPEVLPLAVPKLVPVALEVPLVPKAVERPELPALDASVCVRPEVELATLKPLVPMLLVSGLLLVPLEDAEVSPAEVPLLAVPSVPWTDPLVSELATEVWLDPLLASEPPTAPLVSEYTSDRPQAATVTSQAARAARRSVIIRTR